MSSHSILAHITEKLSNLAVMPKRWVVAYSGGVDSCVLLHSLVAFNRQLSNPLPIIALHINHQLSPNAQQWQIHGEKVAASLGVAYQPLSVVVDQKGKGVEAAARDARYQAFEQFLSTGDLLLMGHHQQDQAETLLLRLFRGAGVRGLGAIPESRELGSASLLRPLLGVTREAIETYAADHQLCWVEDESNQSDDFDRNFIRHHISPLLNARWPNLDTVLAKSAQRMAEADSLLTEVAKQDLGTLEPRSTRAGYSIDRSGLTRLPVARRNNLLRYWCESHGFVMPGENPLALLNHHILTPSSSSACITWAGGEIRVTATRLYLLATMAGIPKLFPPLLWDGESSVDLGALGSLYCSLTPMPNALAIKHQAYRIALREGGERCKPLGRRHSQTLKKLLQEYGLEAWLRDRVPLLYVDDQLAVVGDLWVNEGQAAEPEGGDKVWIRWQPK